MARSRWIMPRADAACGKVFYPDRRTADGHRIGLEFWNRATGRTREGRRLVVYRCGRCGGFHLASRKVEPRVELTEPAGPPYEADQPWQDAEPAIDGSRSLTDSDFEIISQPW